MTSEPSKWDAYVGAVIRIGAPGGVVWVQPAPVTRAVGEYTDPEGRPICVITAHNPGGRVASDAANATAEERLTEELDRRGLTWWPAAGGDPCWTHVEASAAVIGMDEADAIALGAAFRQDAIFVLTPAERRVVSCTDRRVVATGWSIMPDPEGPGRLVVVHIPHASTVIPQDVRETFLVGGRELELEQLRMTDRYTDELYGGLVATDATICFPVSRLVVDPERFLDDEREPMAAKGMGATYLRTSDGRALRGTLPVPEREQLLARFYAPHHRSLTRAVDSALADAGECLIVDGHSFPSRPLPCDLDQTPHRPDICIGTDARHTPRWLAGEAVDVFARRGLRVEVDRPFSGAMVPAQFYGTDMRVHAVMIEINRRLYMEEATGAKLPGFDDFRALVHEALRDLMTTYVSHRD